MFKLFLGLSKLIFQCLFFFVSSSQMETPNLYFIKFLVDDPCKDY